MTFVDAFPVLKGLIAAAEARGPITDTNVQQTIAALKNAAFVQGSSGRNVTGQFSAVVAPLSGSLAVNYRFSRESALAGLNVGLSGASSGNAVLRYLNAFPDNASIKGGSTYALNANAGYRTKFFKRTTTFNLNVFNLAATEYAVISSFALIDGRNHNVNIYGQPLSARLGVTVEF